MCVCVRVVSLGTVVPKAPSFNLSKAGKGHIIEHHGAIRVGLLRSLWETAAESTAAAWLPYGLAPGLASKGRELPSLR